MNAEEKSHTLENSRLVGTFVHKGEVPATVTCTVRTTDDEPMIRWSIHVENVARENNPLKSR